MLNKIVKKGLFIVSLFSIGLCAAQPKIAIVTSKFEFAGIVPQMLCEDAIAHFADKGVMVADEDIFFVPGAIEIPVVVSRLAQSGNYDAIVCLGVAGRNYICAHASYGCQKIAVKYGIPVIFGIVVIENNEETWKIDQYGKMGMYAADAALEMAELMIRL